MNGKENKVSLTKELKVKIKDKGDTKYIITIDEPDGKIDIGGKKDGDSIDIKAKIKEDKSGATDTDIKLKGKFSSSWYKDSIKVTETDNATYKLEGEIQPYSRIWSKPMTIGTMVVGVLLIGGLIWWWIASSRKEDKEEEGL